jgi:hypothetical protein
MEEAMIILKVIMKKILTVAMMIMVMISKYIPFNCRINDE